MTTPDLQEMIDRVTECVEQHDKTGYSGVLKWAELKDIHTLLKAQQEQIAELGAQKETAMHIAHGQIDEIESQAKQIAELEAKAICYVSHNIKWLGEKGAPGWCLGCGKHRSLIRESSEEQQHE